MARRNSQQSISLFPFLAVLVCTMGALILLLLVTTRRIRQEQARYTAAVDVLDDLTSGELADSEQISKDDFVLATAELRSTSDAIEAVESESAALFQDDWLPEVDDSAQQLAELKQQLESAKRLQDDLVTEKVDLEKVLRGQEAELVVLNDQIQELEVELLTSGREVRQLENAETELQALQSEKDDLELQIAQREKMLEGIQAELEEKSAFTDDAEAVLTKRESALVSLRRIVAKSSENLAQESSATLLEFTGTAGTSKVPIVINVDDKGFTFEPSGIVITKKDLIGFPANDNPLLSGIQAAAASRSEGLLPDDAYVLLLVRPTGSLGFYHIQQLLTNANIHFGYELLEADQTVVVGTQNPEEVTVVRQAILEALNRRSTLYGALLAAQQDAAKRRESDWDQPHTSGDGRGQVAAGSRSSDRRGADGRTLQEMMALGRVYAAGEPKPEPKVPQYRGPSSGRGTWSDGGSSVASTVQEPRGFAQRPQAEAGNQSVGGQAAADAFGENQHPFGPESTDATGQLAQSDADGGDVVGQDFSRGDELQLSGVPAEIRSDRSSELSGNMGLKGQLSPGQMPNPSVAEQTFGGEMITADSARNRISPDVDWPFVEAAPQPKGTRPVDPELLSKSTTDGTADSQIDGPQFGSPQFDGPQFDGPQFADAAPQSASRFDSSEAAFQEFANRWQSNSSASGQPRGASTQQQQQAVARAEQNDQSLNSEAVPLVNPVFPPSEFAGQGGGQHSAGGGPPVDPKQSYLQQFLDEVEKQRSQNKPNAELLRLLHRAKGNKRDVLSDNLASPSFDERQPPEPIVGRRKSVSQSTQLQQPTTSPSANTNSPAAQPKSQPVYYVIRIYVSDKQLIVGPFQPIDVTGWSDERVADAAFEGVSETMKDVWSELRADALPAVRFLSAAGSQQRAVSTSQQLKVLEVPTRAMQLEGRDLSVEQFFSDALPPTTHSSAEQNSADQRSAKSPTDSLQQPATTNGRRTSI
ncbi:MAG: hypothetical protein ABJZ55_23500 [Fuerstiella sp.]